jgi:hypothetical protein
MAWSESALWMCPSCGTSNVEGTRYCERCNLPLVPPPPSATAPATGPVGVRPAPVPPPSRRRPSRGARGVRRTTAVVVLLVLVIVVIASLAAVAKYDPGVFSPNAPAAAAAPPANQSNFTVRILSVAYTISTCFGNTTGPGATVTGGTSLNLNLGLTNSGVRTCVVNAASVTTNGFAITRSNTPLTIPPSQKGTLQLTLQTPNVDVNQDVSISLTVSTLG